MQVFRDLNARELGTHPNCRRRFEFPANRKRVSTLRAEGGPPWPPGVQGGEGLPVSLRGLLVSASQGLGRVSSWCIDVSEALRMIAGAP